MDDDDKLEFEIYHKFTNKNEHSNFYLHNNAHIIEAYLSNLGIKTVANTTKAVKNIRNCENKNHIRAETGEYWVAYAGYGGGYMGETSRSIEDGDLFMFTSRIFTCDDRVTLVKYNLESKHSFEFKDSKTEIFESGN